MVKRGQPIPRPPQRRPRKKSKVKWRLFGSVVTIGLLAAVVGGALLAFAVSVTQIPTPKQVARAQTTIVMWADGEKEIEAILFAAAEPLDIDTIVSSVKKTNRLVIVEESWPFGSIASEITFQVQRHAFDYLDAPIKRVTGADSSMHYAPNLVEAYLPNPAKVIAAVRSAL